MIHSINRKDSMKQQMKDLYERAQTKDLSLGKKYIQDPSPINQIFSQICLYKR